MAGYLTKFTNQQTNLAVKKRNKDILPGFRMTLSVAILYLTLIVLVPLSSLLIQVLSGSWSEFVNSAFSARVLASYKVTFLSAFIAALTNIPLGFLVAWVLVRYDFVGRRFVDALIDLPFALPTAVSGITLAALYGPNGWFGKALDWLGIVAVYNPLGITLALIFVSFPFVVRAVQPALQELSTDIEEAAKSLGATPLQVLTRIIIPAVGPSVLTGFTLAFARSLGEYGSVIFISGNLPFRTEIAPLLIVSKLEQYDYAGGTSIALVMLVISFFLLLIINAIQWRTTRWTRASES